MLHRYRDIESAMYLICLWLSYKFIIGSSLEGVEADHRLYAKQMKALKREQAAYTAISFQQVFLNLLGRDNVDTPTRFSGVLLSEEEVEQRGERARIADDAGREESVA